MARTKRETPTIEKTDEFLVGYKARQDGQADDCPYPEEQTEQRRAWQAGYKRREAEEQAQSGANETRPAVFLEGVEAHKAGKPATATPYTSGSVKEKMWLAGWQHSADSGKPAVQNSQPVELTDVDRVKALNARGLDITIDKLRLLPDASLRIVNTWLADQLAGKKSQLPVCLLEFSPQHRESINREVTAADPIEIPVMFGGFSCPGDSSSIGMKIMKTVADHASMDRHFCGKRIKCILSPRSSQPNLPGLEEVAGEVHGMFESKAYSVKPKYFGVTLNLKGESGLGPGLLDLAGREGLLRILEVGTIADKNAKVDAGVKNPPPPKHTGRRKSSEKGAEQKPGLFTKAVTEAKEKAAAIAATLAWFCPACEAKSPCGTEALTACPQCSKEGLIQVGHGDPRADAEGTLYVLHNEMFSVPVRKESGYRLTLSIVRAESGDKKFYCGWHAEMKGDEGKPWTSENVRPSLKRPGRSTQNDAISACVGALIDDLDFRPGNGDIIADLKSYLAEIERGKRPSDLEPAETSDDECEPPKGI